MSVNTARMLNRIFSNPGWKLLLVAGVLALVACFIVKGRKKVIPVVLCIISVCLYIVTAAISGSADNRIAHQGGTDPEKIKKETQAAAGSQQGGEDIGTPDALGGSSADGGAVPTPDVSSLDDGIEYAYWLRLDKASGDYYEANVDDISYKLTDYSNYITVFITNNGSEDAYIGGEYRLQRLTGGKYTDIQDGVDMIYAGVHVQDMPLIVLHDNADGSEITLADETDQFVIKPGQTIKAEFLTMRYAIFDYPEYEGEYRLIYGNVVIDFKLYCDTVC